MVQLVSSQGSWWTFCLTLIWFHVHLVSFRYVIYTYTSCELTVLGIMAYDRFVAICQPLHYHSKMTFRIVQYLIIFAVLYPALACGLCLYLTVGLPLCGNKLHRLFCSNWPVVHLSCMDTTLKNFSRSVCYCNNHFHPPVLCPVHLPAHSACLQKKLVWTQRKGVTNLPASHGDICDLFLLSVLWAVIDSIWGS